MQQRSTRRAALGRREFLKGGTAAIVVTGLSPWLLASSAGDATSHLGRAEFEGFVGQWFQAGGATGEPLQLVAIHDGPASARVEQYTLVFRSGRGAALEEGIYEMSPPSGGDVEMFLQPGGEVEGEPRMRASFAVFRPLSPAACAGAAT